MASFRSDLDFLSRSNTSDRLDSGNEVLRLGGVLSALTSFDDPECSDSSSTAFRRVMFSDAGTSFSEGVGAQCSLESVFDVDSNEDKFFSEPAAHVSGEILDSKCAESSPEGVSDDVIWEGSCTEELTDCFVFGDPLLEVRVELKSAWLTVEGVGSAEVGAGLGLICEPESGRM